MLSNTNSLRTGGKWEISTSGLKSTLKSGIPISDILGLGEALD